ncbi:PilN domain-containing protein, partial [bacterium]|nr:PilN domain-containing protein [bacterium]
AQERELRFPLLLISRSLPAGVWLKSISFQENDFPQAHLVIQVVSEQGLSDFISLLLSQPEVKGVTVGSIKKEKTFSEVEIGLTVKFVADAGRKQ